mmetsp:Transcript_15292/g.23166  ORF Transcript_15292/g.23166 Transcript_15292/m.23166 type:complete len:88 (-) Transcript_15292:24-287(-)
MNPLQCIRSQREQMGPLPHCAACFLKHLAKQKPKKPPTSISALEASSLSVGWKGRTPHASERCREGKANSMLDCRAERPSRQARLLS